MRGMAMAAAVLLAPIPAAAAAQCQARIEAPGQVRSAPLDPFLARSTLIEIPVSVRYTSDQRCPLTITATSSGGGRRVLRSGPHTLPYVLTDASSFELPNAAGLVRGFVIPPGAPTPTRSVKLLGRIDVEQAVPAGSYTDQVELRLYNAATGELLDGPATLALEVEAPQRVQINLAGVRGPFGAGAGYSVMDFGRLETGETQSAYLQVRANSDVSIVVESERGGVLAPREGSGPGVPYMLRLDGQTVALRGGASGGLRRSPTRSLAGQSYEVQVTIGAVEGLFAGDYQDVVTLTVVPD